MSRHTDTVAFLLSIPLMHCQQVDILLTYDSHIAFSSKKGKFWSYNVNHVTVNQFSTKNKKEMLYRY